MDKKKIAWITPDCFADCDIPFVPNLLNRYDICWIIYLTKGSRFQECDFDQYANLSNLEIHIVTSKIRERDPRKVFDYINIIKIYRNFHPDIIYSNVCPGSPWAIPMFMSMFSYKTIITAHQGRVHEGMGHFRYNNFMRDLVYNRIKNVNMFSKSQACFFHDRYPKSKVFIIPLALKYFGEPQNIKREDGTTTFLSFGIINYAKHIDLLIKAANILYEQGQKNFKVVIKGGCQNWSDYEKLIKYPEIIESDIRLLKNEEIPDLFASSDFFVQPYRVISQSGPFKIAMNYNLPLITSDLPGFADEMNEGTTGFLFKTDSLDSLVDVMRMAISIKNDGKEYDALKSRMQEYVNENYSNEVLISEYINMFETVMRE